MRRPLRLRWAALVLLLGPALPTTAAVAEGPAPTEIGVTLIDDLSPRLAGRPTDFSATLVSGDTVVPGEVLTLWVQEAGAAAFVEAGRAVTDASGRVTVWATLTHSARVRWTHDAGASYAASTSGDLGVEIAPRVTSRVNDRTLRRGQRFVATGRTDPAKPGCPVLLWRGEVRPLTTGPAPVRLARTTVRADGSYRLVRRFSKPARMRVVVQVAACAGNAAGLASYRTLTVR